MRARGTDVAEKVGWQVDGSYVPCPSCGHVPPADDPSVPGVAMHVMPRTSGTAIHKGDCPTVDLPQDVKRKLLDDLAEMDRVRRRGAAEARNFWIG